MTTDRLQVCLESSRADETHRWRIATGTTLTEPVAILHATARGAALRVAGRPARAWDAVTDAIDAMPALAAEHAGALWVGYFAYDLGRLFEHLPGAPRDDLALPLFAFALVHPTEDRTPITRPPHPPSRPTERPPPRSTFTPSAYQHAVARAIEYIRAGDIFQVNLSQRFTAPLLHRPIDVYRRLQATTPAAYAAYLDFGDHQLISNSPELFIDVRQQPDGRRCVTNRPIKGTRPRLPGMFEALRDSAKDQSELAMIVDLQRNDLGRVCRTGSVRVIEPRQIETHPTVLHGVATIRGELREDVRPSDLLRAVFPCGSITGCPKIRAMQIIDELEPVARGPYCGAIGWVDAKGDMQFNVAIRTIVVTGGQAHFAVGGGIVADSDPAGEFDETIHKSRALADALGISLPALSDQAVAAATPTAYE